MALQPHTNHWGIQLAVILLSVVALTTVAATGSVAAQSQAEIQWTGAGTSGSGTGFTQDIQVESPNEPISFGGESSLRLQLTDTNTGDSVVLIPTGENYNVEEFEINPGSLTSYNDGEYSPADDPTIEFIIDRNDPFVNDYPVEINGDPSIFYENTFNSFSVSLIDTDGSTIAETEETRTRATDYAANFTPEYNGSALAVNRESGVQSDWYVELRQDIFEPGTPVENSANAGSFIIDTDAIDYNRSQEYELIIYPSSTQTELKDIIIKLPAGNIEDDQIVDGPVGEPSDDDSDEDTDDSENPQFDDGGSGLQTSEVRLDGSTIRISSEGLTSFSVEGLPDNVSVSNVGDGVYDSNAGEILIGGPTNPAPDTYEFTLNPDSDEYAVGDTVEFTVQGNPVVIPVVEAATIPTELADNGVNGDSYTAVVGTDEKLGAGNLAGAIQSWSGDDGTPTGTIGGTDVSAGELSEMIKYWSNEVSSL